MLRVVSGRANGFWVASLALQTRWIGTSAAILPVGIFVDLDNVKPKTFSRDDAQQFAEPLKQFAAVTGELNTFQAFGNRATQTYVSQQERERDFDQEWQAWDGQTAVTGYDEEGLLRCGVCGAKMKLTKKDKKRGWTMEKKLQRHMKQLHDREQAKRNNARGQKRGRSEKTKTKSLKYKRAQIGLSRLGISSRESGSNELFTVLGEQGIRCYNMKDVDSGLINAALKWMDRQQELEREAEKKGCLLVVSEDSDFKNLLLEAQSRNFLAVSATPISMEQTAKLVTASDMVLRLKRETEEEGNLSFGPLVLQPCSGAGAVFLSDMFLGDD